MQRNKWYIVDFKYIEPKTAVSNTDKIAINFEDHSIEFDENDLNSIKPTSFLSSTLETEENGKNSSVNFSKMKKRTLLEN